MNIVGLTNLIFRLQRKAKKTIVLVRCLKPLAFNTCSMLRGLSRLVGVQHGSKPAAFKVIHCLLHS